MNMDRAYTVTVYALSTFVRFYSLNNVIGLSDWTQNGIFWHTQVTC